VTVALVMLASFHHFYQDFAEPLAAQVVGEVASYASSVPPLVVTIFGALLLVYRSGLRWSTTPLFLYTGVVAWTIGGYAAVIDATPWLNQYLHNTLWVPAYFHVLMALGVLSFVLGAVYHVLPEITHRRLRDRIGRDAAALVCLGGGGLAVTWFISGVLGQPRRYPMYLPELTGLTWIGTAWALCAVVGAVVLFVEIMRGVGGGVRWRSVHR
jgi:cytochrome c oxidase subunit 1